MRKSGAEMVVVVAASPLLIAGAIRWWGTAQAATPKLTADDRAEILNLYAAYTHYFDFADVDPRDMVKKVWTPDGVFVNVTPIPESDNAPTRPTCRPGNSGRRAPT